MCDRRPWNIETLKIDQQKLSEIQMAITFHSDVWFTCIIYRGPWNWPRKLSTNSNGHNFWLECMIDAHDISRHSKLNNGSSREILMAITFHSNVRFTCIINRDPQNSPRKFWSALCHLNSDYPNLSSLTGLRTFWTTSTLLRRLWASNNLLMRYYVVPSPQLSRELQGSGSQSYQNRLLTVLSN